MKEVNLMKSILSRRGICMLLALILGLSCLPTVAFAEKTLVFSRPEDLLNLDPHDHKQISGYIFTRHVYDTLLELNEDGTIGYGLATSYATSEDGKSVTLQLREGVKFHNGEDFNASCVEATFKRILEEGVAMSGNYPTLVDCVVDGDYQVTLVMSEPNAALINNLTILPIIPAQAYAQQGTALFEHPIGTGPFEFVEWLPKQRFTLKKFDGYWGEPAKIDTLVYLTLTEDSTRTAALLANEIDVATGISPDQVDLIATNPDLEITRSPAWDQTYIMMNCATTFSDPRVREAFCLAIDRDIIVENIVGSRPANQPFPEGTFGFNPDRPPITRDLERARQLLEEADAVGTQVSIDVLQGVYAKSDEVVTVICEQLNEAGFDASFQNRDNASFGEIQNTGKYQAFFVGGAAMMGVMNNMFQSRIINNIFQHGYENDQLVQIMTQANASFDDDTRYELYQQATDIMLEDFAPWTFIYQIENVNVQKKNVTGVYYRGDGVTDLRKADIVEQ